MKNEEHYIQVGKDIAGKKFNSLTAIKFEYNRQSPSRKTAYWSFRCDCGKIIIRARGDVVRNKIKSCGCKHKEYMLLSKKYNGLSSLECRLYSIWHDIHRRCYNKKRKEYPNYGGRGIKVCDEWKDNLYSFIEWAKNNGYKPDLTIDRIDVNRDYSPDNCRWVDRKIQANNKTNNHYLTYKGKTQSMADWCRELNLNYFLVRSRINNYKWSVEDAFEKRTRNTKIHC